MTLSNLRVPLLVALTLGLAASVTGCSDVDCSEIQRYNDAQLDKKLTTPDGLNAPAVRDTHAIPGGAPPAGATTMGGCLVKPPQLVEVPNKGD